MKPLTTLQTLDLYLIARNPRHFWAGTPFPALEERGLIRAVNTSLGGVMWIISDLGEVYLRSWPNETLRIQADEITRKAGWR